MNPPEIVTVGSAVIDHTYTLSNLPEPDGGAFIREHTTAAGGVAANVAAALTELGHETGIVTRLGTDTSIIHNDLQARQIDTSRVTVGSEETSYSLILREESGQRMVIAGGKSVPNLHLTEADLVYLSNAAVVFTSAYAPDAVVSTLIEARERGEIQALVFDLAGPLSELKDRATTPATVDRMLSVADLFVVGTVAARSYFEADTTDAATILAQGPVSRAAVTRGRQGALLVNDGTVTEIPAFETPVEDTTGAGDVFTAGLIHKWLVGSSSVVDAGRFAGAGAGLSCTALGARGFLPTQSAIESLLREESTS